MFLLVLLKLYNTKNVEAKYIINNLISINILSLTKGELVSATCADPRLAQLTTNIGVNTNNNKDNKPIVIYKE